MTVMKIKICVVLVCIMACFSGHAFASGKSISRTQKNMPLIYQQVMQSELEYGDKVRVVLLLLPALERYRTATAVKHMSWTWPWDDGDDEDDDGDDDSGDDGSDNGENQYVCILNAVVTMLDSVKSCDSNFGCVFTSVFNMVVTIESCTE
jgi:hypothetical protein